MTNGKAVLLKQILTILDSLEDELQKAVDALAHGDLNALSAHTTAKQALLRQLQDKMNPDWAAFDSPHVPKLLAKLHRCHTLNESTGGAISNAMRHNALLLSLLGQGSGPVAYEPSRSAKSTIPQNGRSLATA